MEFSFTPETPKEEVFEKVHAYLAGLTIEVSSTDMGRPWGGFDVIDGSSTPKFISQHYPGYDLAKIMQYGSEVMPKILVVGPEEELSWQYHYRRAELWRCVYGPVGFHRSADNIQGKLHILKPGEIVQYDPLERHRLKGLGNWGVVAEVWQHTDPDNPSDEEDIVRLDDKYGRTT